jgi:transcriptional regulator CtsR
MSDTSTRLEQILALVWSEKMKPTEAKAAIQQLIDEAVLAGRKCICVMCAYHREVDVLIELENRRIQANQLQQLKNGDKASE